MLEDKVIIAVTISEFRLQRSKWKTTLRTIVGIVIVRIGGNIIVVTMLVS